MARGFRLRDAQALVDVADADLAGQQQAQDPKAGRVGQRLEEAFEFGQWLGHIYSS